MIKITTEFENERKTIYLIYSPLLDQSIAIAKFIKKYIPNTKIYGIKMEHENIKRASKKYFSKTLLLEDLIFYKQEYKCIHIPTGAMSTKYLLEQLGQVTLREITLTHEALRVFDKQWLINFAKDSGIPVPKTWNNLEDVTEYPIFYKPAFEGKGKLRRISFSYDETIKNLGNNIHNYIFQEYIDSKGTYGVCFLADKGEMIVEFIHFEKESFPRDGGSAVIIEKFFDSRLIKYTKRLISGLGYSGWGLAEFKYCPKRKDFVLMEINAKFWASCEFAFVNEPHFLEFLFGIKSQEKPVSSMFFVNRGFFRGPGFIIKSLPILLRGVSYRFYPGWIKAIAIGLMLFAKDVKQKISRQNPQ